LIGIDKRSCSSEPTDGSEAGELLGEYDTRLRIGGVQELGDKVIDVLDEEREQLGRQLAILQRHLRCIRGGMEIERERDHVSG